MVGAHMSASFSLDSNFFSVHYPSSGHNLHYSTESCRPIRFLGPPVHAGTLGDERSLPFAVTIRRLGLLLLCFS